MPFLAAETWMLVQLTDQFGCKLPCEPQSMSSHEDEEGYIYCSLHSSFDPASLTQKAQEILKSLEAIGATKLYATYDGGCDEGWAHAQHFVIGETTRSAGDTAALLARTPLGAKLRQEIPIHNQKFYQDWDDAMLLQQELDDLAMELACALTNGGFGTGEYLIYGAFWADLITGKLIDDPDPDAKGAA